MGILSELVVTIGGEDSPLRATMERVKASLAGLGDSAAPAGLALGENLGGGISAGIGPQIGLAMRQALAPMNAMMATLTHQFDRVGGTIITMARRIDAHMKFPAFEARLIALEEKIEDPFIKGSVKAIRYLAKVAGFINHLGDVAKKGMSKLGMGAPPGAAAGYGKLSSKIGGIAPAAKKASAAVSSLHGSLLRTLGAASSLGAIGLVFGKAISGASHLNETLNKVDVIFGMGSDKVKADAQEMANKFGIVKSEFMDMQSSFGTLLIGMGGKTKLGAAVMSGDLAKLAADASSMFNMSFQDAGEKIAAGLRGESEPIHELGVDLSEANVAQEAMRMGVKKTGGELTTQQKVMARSSLIMRELRVASGDLASTNDGFANALRGAWGRIQNALDSFGVAIMPVVERFMGGLNGMLSGLQSWVDNNQAMFARWSESLATAFQFVKWVAGELWAAISDAFARVVAEEATWTSFNKAISDGWQWLKGQAMEVYNGIGIIWRNWTSIMEYTGVMVMGKVTNIGEAFSWLMGVAGTVGDYLQNNWVTLLGDAAVGAWTVLSNLATNLKNLFIAVWEAVQGNGFHFEFTPLLDGFKAAAKEFPKIAKLEYSSVADQLEAITEKMGKTETARIEANAKAAREAAKPKAPERPGAAKKPADKAKENKVETTDLAGYFKKLQEGAIGKGGAIERTAKAAEKTVKEQRKANKSLSRIAAQGVATGFAVGPA
jgi:hypothetical protein